MTLDKSREELRVIGRQFIRSGTSVAANYREASRARSDKEFIAKIEICAQEADETQLWLEPTRRGLWPSHRHHPTPLARSG